MKKRLLASIAIPLLLAAVLVSAMSGSTASTEVVQAASRAPALLHTSTYPYSTFLSLIDTPGSYSGQAGHVPVVNSGETALDFASGLYWDNTNDLLGIGPERPTASLHVVGTTIDTAPDVEGVQVAVEDHYASIELAGSSGGLIDFSSGNGTDYRGRILYASGDYMYLSTAGTLAVTIDANQRLGVKDSTPSYDLDVAGTIRATDDLRAEDDLFVADDATVSGGVQIAESLNVDGPASVDGLTVTGNALVSGDLEAENQIFQGRASSANDPSHMLMGLDNSAGGAMLWSHDNFWGPETIFDDDDAEGPKYVLWFRWIAYNKTHSDYQQGTAILTPGDHVTLYQRAGPPRVDLSLYFGIYEDYEVMVLQPVLPEDYFRVVIWAMWLSD